MFAKYSKTLRELHGHLAENKTNKLKANNIEHKLSKNTHSY